MNPIHLKRKQNPYGTDGTMNRFHTGLDDSGAAEELQGNIKDVTDHLEFDCFSRVSKGKQSLSNNCFILGNNTHILVQK